MKKRNVRKGFTLVELVIVIAVIAILAGVLIPTFGSVVDKAQQSALQQKAANEWKEAYALDLSDGYLDGYEGAKEDDNLVSKKFAGYGIKTEDNKTVSTYKATDGKWDVEFDGSSWKFTPHTHDKLGTAESCSKCGASKA